MSNKCPDCKVELQEKETSILSCDKCCNEYAKKNDIIISLEKPTIKLECTKCKTPLIDMEDSTYKCNDCFQEFYVFRGKLRKLYGNNCIYDMNK